LLQPDNPPEIKKIREVLHGIILIPSFEENFLLPARKNPCGFFEKNHSGEEHDLLLLQAR
jgi:hypothetical protein